MSKKKHHKRFSKSAKINRAHAVEQRAKYSSLQLTANCIAAKGSLRHYFKLI